MSISLEDKLWSVSSTPLFGCFVSMQVTGKARASVEHLMKNRLISCSDHRFRASI